MGKKQKFHYYIKSQEDKSKPALIYVMFTLDKRYKISTGLSVLPELWSSSAQRACFTNLTTQEKQRQANRVNKRLNKLAESLEKIFEDYRGLETYRSSYSVAKHGEGILQFHYTTNCRSLVERARRAIVKVDSEELQEEAKSAGGIKPTEYFQKYVDSLEQRTVRRTKTKLKEGTMYNHKNVLSRFREFLHDCPYVNDDFRIFNKNFEERFDSFLLNKKNYTPSTVCTTKSIMKVWLRQALDDKLIEDTSFTHWQSKVESPKHIYLTNEEIDRIYSLQFTEENKAQWGIDIKSSIEQTRDIFVIGCKTGLRLSDLSHLNMAEWDLGELPSLTINIQKTQSRVRIPIGREVIEIYRKYGGKLPTPANKSHYNKQIQKCGMLAGIDDPIFQVETKGGVARTVEYKKWELIASHTARRSFATNMYLACKDPYAVMKVTGHKTMENFMRYINISDYEASEALRAFV